MEKAEIGKKRKLDANGSQIGEALAQKLSCQRPDDVTVTKMTVDAMVVAGNGNGIANDAPITDENLLALMQKTGYKITQENGQRKYGGPPPDWGNRPPPRGTEVFVGKIPRDVFEDELVPVFETAGKIYELRLMMDFDGKNRGYAFVMYYTKAEAKGAVKKLNNYEIRKGRLLGVCYSVDNCRLFVGGIPKSKKKDDILTEMHKVTEGVVDVIVYPSASDKTKNRGFAFVEYTSHRAAAMARRKLIPGRIQLWGHPIAVDWAEPEQQVDEDIMDQVKVLYVRNLMLDTTEDTLQNIFSQFHPGSVERVKKIRDYAFVHFSTREACMLAMEKINGTEIDHAEVEVTLAKPVDKNDYNRMAKVGAKVLSQANDKTGAMVQTPSFVNQNGMILYQAGLCGSDVVYYPVNQTNIAANGLVRQGQNGATRLSNNRSNYLGYSAGKATFGRYYAKNNTDRSLDMSGASSVDLPCETLCNIADTGIPIIKGNSGVPGIPAASTVPITQAIHQYVAPITQNVSPLVPALVPHQKNAESALEELCQTNMWGAPSYQLFTTASQDTNRPMFLYKIAIPAFQTIFPSTKMSENIEEAKVAAAEEVLSHIGFQADGTPAVIPMATVISPPANGYQNIYAPPPIQVGSTTMAPPPVSHQYVPVTTPSPTIPMSFVDPNSMVQPITVMYQ